MRLPNFETALCVGMSVNTFFPDTEKENQANKAFMQRICKQCPMYDDCLEYSLSVMVEGIWAGYDKIDRRKMRREQNRKALPLELSIGGVFTSYTPNAVRQRNKRKREATP